ncbi:MAG: pilus assembly protein PilM [Firmicutes bacterium]|nr:pilus assembly protein PilM [Bacillota bacterium]
MARKALGLDLDYDAIRAVEVLRKGRSRLVAKLAQYPLASGTIADGKLAKPEELVRSLNALLQAEGFSAESTVLGIRSAWVTVKTHRLPHMTKRELDKALEFEIPDLVSFPVQSPRDICYDYFINSPRSDGELEVVVVACPRQHLDPFIRVFRETDLSLEVIDVPALGWPALLAQEGRRAFVEVSAEQTTIMVVFGQVFKVLRVVPIGSMHLQQGVQEAFGCSPQEAWDFLNQRDLDYLLLEGQGSKRLLRAAIQQFSGSVLQTLDFLRAQERAASFRSMLDEVVLVGDVAEVAGFGDLLAKEVDLPVRPLDQLNLSVSFPGPQPARLSAFGSALALAARGVEA